MVVSVSGISLVSWSERLNIVIYSTFTYCLIHGYGSSIFYLFCLLPFAIFCLLGIPLRFLVISLFSSSSASIFETFVLGRYRELRLHLSRFASLDVRVRWRLSVEVVGASCLLRNEPPCVYPSGEEESVL